MVEFVVGAAVAAAGCAVPNRPVTVIRAAPPDYPPVAPPQGSGTVFVAVTVGASGSVTAMRITRSPSTILNQAALRAARDSTYQPQLSNCMPVVGAVLLPVHFWAPSATIKLRISASGEKTAAVSTYATVFRYPDQVSVNAVYVSQGADDAAAFAANEATFTKIANETGGIGTARTIVGPVLMGSRLLRTPSPGEPTPAPHVAVLRDMELRVDRFDDVPRVVRAYEANEASPFVNWFLTDSSEAENEALSLAIREARKEIDVFARAHRLRVVGVRRTEPKRATRPYYVTTHPGVVPERPPFVGVERDVTVTYVLRR